MKIGIFNVRVIKEGERYGLFDCFVHDNKKPLVEFFDSRSVFSDVLGMFVSRYFCDSFLKIPDGQGILLDTGSKDWQLDSEQVSLAKEFVMSQI